MGVAWRSSSEDEKHQDQGQEVILCGWSLCKYSHKAPIPKLKQYTCVAWYHAWYIVVWLHLMLNRRSGCPKTIIIFHSKSVCPEARLHTSHPFKNQPQKEIKHATIRHVAKYGCIWGLKKREIEKRYMPLKVCWLRVSTQEDFSSIFKPARHTLYSFSISIDRTCFQRTHIRSQVDFTSLKGVHSWFLEGKQAW